MADQRLERIDQHWANLERSDRFRSERECSLEEPGEKVTEKPQALNEAHAFNEAHAPNEPQAFIELQAEPLTLPPVELAIKPGPFTEPTIPQASMEATIPPPPSEPHTPNVVCHAKEHCFGVHIRHRVGERIGLRASSLPFTPFSAFIRPGLYLAGTLLTFGSWTLVSFLRDSQLEPSDHG